MNQLKPFVLKKKKKNSKEIIKLQELCLSTKKHVCKVHKDRINFIDIDTFCTCSRHWKHISTYFFGCEFCNAIWKCIKDWISNTKSMSMIFSALKWLKKEACETSWIMRAKKMTFACIVYHIWSAHNRKQFLRTNGCKYYCA